MLSIEEYIAKRKNEDRLDEFNIKLKDEHLRICVNYVFDYYNRYLNPLKQQREPVIIGNKEKRITTDPEFDYLSISEVCEILQLSRYTISELIKDGKLKGSKIGKAYRIRRSDVDRFIVQNVVD